MIPKECLAIWLRKLASRPAGASDPEHIAQLRVATTDSTWVLYLDAIANKLQQGAPYGRAVADPMSLHLSGGVQERLRTAKTSAEVDEILLDTAFELLRNLSDHDKLTSMLNQAGFRYSQHREYTRGAGPYDIDLYTAMTQSHPGSRLTGQTVNVSFSFTDAGELEGLRSYSMGSAPANPLRRGDEVPDYATVYQQPGVSRFAEPLWWLRLTTRTHRRRMVVTPKLAEFMQGWAMQADGLDLDLEKEFQLLGRARPFSGVQLIEIGDGTRDALPVSQLPQQDRICIQRLLADRSVIWRLHPMILRARTNAYPYNCFLVFKCPTEPEAVERAKMTYADERAKVPV